LFGINHEKDNLHILFVAVIFMSNIRSLNDKESILAISLCIVYVDTIVSGEQVRRFNEQFKNLRLYCCDEQVLDFSTIVDTFEQMELT
jgi:hypothetical protein